MENSVVGEQDRSLTESNQNNSLQCRSPRRQRSSSKWQYRPRIRLSHQPRRMSASIQASKTKQTIQLRKSKYALIQLSHITKQNAGRPSRKQEVQLQPQTKDLYRSFRNSASHNIRVRIPKEPRKESEFRMKCLSKTDYEAIGRQRIKLVCKSNPKFHNKYVLVENRVTPLRLYVSNKVRWMMLRDLMSQNYEKMQRSVKNVINCANEYEWVNRLEQQNILEREKIIEKRPLKYKKISQQRKTRRKLEL